MLILTHSELPNLVQMNTGDWRNWIHPILSHPSFPISVLTVFTPPQPSSDTKSAIQEKMGKEFSGRSSGD